MIEPRESGAVAAIVARSIEASRVDEQTDRITDEDGEVQWFAYEKRGDAIREYIAATDPSYRVKDVDCRRAWMRVDYGRIEEAAHDAVFDDSWTPPDDYRVATWEDEGYIFEECKRGDERARPFWRCEWAG